MRRRSIRWTLLFWYAVVLVGSQALLVSVLHDELDGMLFQDADNQVRLWLATVDHKIEEYPDGKLAAEVRGSLPDDATFAVWNADGELVASSDGSAGDSPADETIETRGDVREHVARGPRGTWIRLGKNTEVEHGRIRRFLRVVTWTSLGIILLALGGGWFLITRALASIDGMSASARRISAENLTERLETGEVPQELTDLARTLNESFDRLEAAFERQARFTADASHELRTPLSIVMSHLELAVTEDRTAEQLRERAEVCLGAARRMRSVVEGLLTLARADAGDVALDRSDFDLATLVDEVVETSVSPLAAERSVTVACQLSPTPVNADSERLRELVTNLCVNAVRHNDHGGHVEIGLAPHGNHVVLTVADSGPGIAPEHQERIFERFYRIDRARSRAEGGSGLGLAIARWVAELHGGTLDVTSAPGGGATFTLTLPTPETGD